MKRVLRNQEYTSSEEMKVELEEYERQNDPMLRFFDYCDEEGYQLENEPTSNCYSRYKEFCLAENIQSVSKVEFSRRVTKTFDFVTVSKRINGKVYRVFQKEGE